MSNNKICIPDVLLVKIAALTSIKFNQLMNSRKLLLCSRSKNILFFSWMGVKKDGTQDVLLKL